VERGDNRIKTSQAGKPNTLQQQTQQKEHLDTVWLQHH